MDWGNAGPAYNDAMLYAWAQSYPPEGGIPWLTGKQAVGVDGNHGRLEQRVLTDLIRLLVPASCTVSVWCRGSELSAPSDVIAGSNRVLLHFCSPCRTRDR